MTNGGVGVLIRPPAYCDLFVLFNSNALLLTRGRTTVLSRFVVLQVSLHFAWLDVQDCIKSITLNVIGKCRLIQCPRRGWLDAPPSCLCHNVVVTVSILNFLLSVNCVR